MLSIKGFSLCEKCFCDKKFEKQINCLNVQSFEDLPSEILMIGIIYQLRRYIQINLQLM